MKSASLAKTSLVAVADMRIQARSFDDVLTPEKAAVDELRRRRRSTVLKSAVDSALRGKRLAPVASSPHPHALLFRQVGTPNSEMFRFLGSAKRLGLRPLVLEYHTDKLVSAGNPFKRSLGKMPLYLHTGSDGRDIVRYRTVVDFNKYNGKQIRTVQTHDGVPLVEFHHKLLRASAKINPETVCFDASEWFEKNGSVAHRYYEALMTLLIRDCVMFESYESTPALVPFMHAVVLPAFEKVYERFGVRPLISRLVPKGEETRLFWDSYPRKVEKYM